MIHVYECSHQTEPKHFLSYCVLFPSSLVLDPVLSKQKQRVVFTVTPNDELYVTLTKSSFISFFVINQLPTCEVSGQLWSKLSQELQPGPLIPSNLSLA
jgi:hypothetical protein